jgi:hypothetical protein
LPDEAVKAASDLIYCTGIAWFLFAQVRETRHRTARHPACDCVKEVFIQVAKTRSVLRLLRTCIDEHINDVALTVL